LGLDEDDLLLTGYVSDDDLLLLYNACTLFVFPSWHEGFGLPVLEAMSCGKAVIAANCSSLPEVVGRVDALFAPHDDVGMAAKMAEVLSNEAFREELERHGLVQARKFSWEASARRAWAALEALHQQRQQVANMACLPTRRLRLAFVSPLPPAQSGIADYAIELLPELARHYDITVVVQQEAPVTDPWILANAPIRDVVWFRENVHFFDRVVYQFGNSSFHGHMFEMLADIPGIVVLHDFFLSGITAWIRGRDDWLIVPRTLLHSHGWKSVYEWFHTTDTGKLVMAYPFNLAVLQQSLAVIVHSDVSRRLARQFYGDQAAQKLSLIPHLRTSQQPFDKKAARAALGLQHNDFVVCSFGFLSPAKLNQRLLESWLNSPLGQNTQCYLIFVGENIEGEYGQHLLQTIDTSASQNRIIITGFAEMSTYRLWLTAADLAVQLRALSRGETSGTVLDCMNYGLPTVVNAHGSMADLPQDAVWMLPDIFENVQLTDALIALWQDFDRRTSLGMLASAHIREHHDPRQCADQYRDIIEDAYHKADGGPQGIFKIAKQNHLSLAPADWPNIALALAENIQPQPRPRQLLLDISELVQRDGKTGIQRVTRAILKEIVLNPPAGWQVEPVYATEDQPGYRYARRFMCGFLNVPDAWGQDAIVEVWAGDVFLGLDLSPYIVPSQEGYLLSLRNRGVKVFFVVYDLLPILLQEVFPPSTHSIHQRWLATITRFDGALCISRSVLDELHEWLQVFGSKRELPYTLNLFHLGADVDSTVPTQGMPVDALQTLQLLQVRPTFLMVGTLEPRKGYLQTLQAFDQLWTQGLDINLVIVGKEGWINLPDEARSDIPETVNNLRLNHEFGKRIFWLQGISDEYLEKVYAASTCLIAASYGEGFGLPLIEAAFHDLPLLVRSIPVFHEVTAEHAYFFPDSRDPEVICEAVQSWLKLYHQGKHLRSKAMPHQTWEESSKQLLDAILDATPPYKTWLPDGVRRYYGADPRLHTEVGKQSGVSMCTTGKSGMLTYGPYAHFEPGRYRLIIHGTADNWSGQEWMDVVCDSGRHKLLHIDLRDGFIREWQKIRVFEIESACTDLEIRLWVSEQSRLRVDGFKVLAQGQVDTCAEPLLLDLRDSQSHLRRVSGTYKYDFAVVNKSYAKDIEWSVALFKSWQIYSVREAPFFIVVPGKDITFFEQRFRLEIERDSITVGRLEKSSHVPVLLAEEDVLGVADILCPSEFAGGQEGWHIQQYIKLCFSKTMLARHYLTLDSAMIFTKPFDYLSLYSEDKILCTAARLVNKKDFYDGYLYADENGWLNGELVNLGESLDFICAFMGNDSVSTHSYIATSGFFDSEFAVGLENYAKLKGLDGFVGLISAAPYEFAWYGEYVFMNHRDKFRPKGPLIMQPCNEVESLQEIYTGNFMIPENLIGVLFQPPASNHCEPHKIYELLMKGGSKNRPFPTAL
jgi:glycosyltransferase involved in cell wall biosynthesis